MSDRYLLNKIKDGNRIKVGFQIITLGTQRFGIVFFFFFFTDRENHQSYTY